MASNKCNFCDKVGSQPITNHQTIFNYSCLEVKKKKKVSLQSEVPEVKFFLFTVKPELTATFE
jgi:hypothetical protein